MGIPRLQKDITSAITYITKMQESHIYWAEYFEKFPEKEKEYVATGEWDDAKTHREDVVKYDNVIKILNHFKR